MGAVGWVIFIVFCLAWDGWFHNGDRYRKR